MKKIFTILALLIAQSSLANTFKMSVEFESSASVPEIVRINSSIAERKDFSCEMKKNKYHCWVDLEVTSYLQSLNLAVISEFRPIELTIHSIEVDTGASTCELLHHPILSQKRGLGARRLVYSELNLDSCH